MRRFPHGATRSPGPERPGNGFGRRPGLPRGARSEVEGARRRARLEGDALDGLLERRGGVSAELRGHELRHVALDDDPSGHEGLECSLRIG